MNTPFAPGTSAAKDEQWKRKLAALLLAFVIGFLLAWFLKKCPQPGEGGGGGGGGGSSMAGGRAPGAPGAPDPMNGGPGAGAGGGGGGGGGLMAVGGGGNPEGGDGNGENPTGKSPPGKDGGGGDVARTTGRPGEEVAGDALLKSVEGNQSGKDFVTDTTPPGPPPANFKSAPDFTYDSTGLPRYASGVTGIASGISNDTVRHRKSTTAAIVTTDSFDKVVDWYKGQVPPGWHSSQVGDMEGMAKALSPDAIGKMLSGAMNGGPVDTASVAAAQNGHKTGVAIFDPPDKTKDPRSIMIVVKPGSPTQVMMMKRLQ
ncbi:MAG: hypothetical protein ABI186_04680 [Candidatus Elarobacter sp.]